VSQAGHGYSPDKLYIAVTVANRGRRPVTIANVWFDTSEPSKRKHLIVSDSLMGPRDLPEGKSTLYLMDQSDLDLTMLTRVVASDQTGREWRGKINQK
jgi:hypothetical protein